MFMFAHVRALRSSSVFVQTEQREDNSRVSLCNRVVCAFRAGFVLKAEQIHCSLWFCYKTFFVSININIEKESKYRKFQTYGTPRNLV
jgi:hypothetical protein